MSLVNTNFCRWSGFEEYDDDEMKYIAMNSALSPERFLGDVKSLHLFLIAKSTPFSLKKSRQPYIHTYPHMKGSREKKSFPFFHRPIFHSSQKVQHRSTTTNSKNIKNNDNHDVYDDYSELKSKAIYYRKSFIQSNPSQKIYFLLSIQSNQPVLLFTCSSNSQPNQTTDIHTHEQLI